MATGNASPRHWNGFGSRYSLLVRKLIWSVTEITVSLMMVKILSINTLGKRTKCTFEGEHFAEYLDGAYDLGTAKLVELKGLWYLHIPVTQAVEDFQKENVRHVVGIDPGLRFFDR